MKQSNIIGNHLEGYLSYSRLDRDELQLTPDQPQTFHLGRTTLNLRRQPRCSHPATHKADTMLELLWVTQVPQSSP